MIIKYNVEKKTIIALIKLCYKSINPESVSKLLKKCNVKALNRLIGESGIAGVLYYYLGNSSSLKLPDSTMRAMKQSAGITAIKNSLLSEQLFLIAKKLNERGIDYIVLKGIPLLNTAYQNDSMRAVSDIDLLIKREQYNEVIDALGECGYYFPEDKMKDVSSLYTQDWVEKERSEILFVKKDIIGESMADIHFDMHLFDREDRFNSMFPLNEIDWFGNTRFVIIGNEEVRCLSPKIDLLYSVVHYSVKHSFMGIKWLLDICQMRSYKAEIYLSSGKTLFESNINFKRMNEITNRLSDSILNPISEKSFLQYDILRKYRARLFLDPNSPIGKVKRKLYKVSYPKKISDRVKFILYYLFEGEAIKHRIKGSEKRRFDILQPFKLCIVYIKEIRRQRN